MGSEQRRLWMIKYKTTTTKTTTTRRDKQSEEHNEYEDPTLADSYYESYDTYYNSEEETKVVDEVEVRQTCKYTLWSMWSSRSSACGSGVKSRWRSLTNGSVQYCTFSEDKKSCFGTECGSGRVRERATLIPRKFSQHDKEQGYE